MNDEQERNDATTALLFALTRTLIAQGVIQKEDLLSDLGRMAATGGFPAKQHALLQELVRHFPNR